MRNETAVADGHLRVSVVTGKKCVYRRQAPRGLATRIMQIFGLVRGGPEISISLVLDPVHRMNGRGGFLPDAIQRSFILSAGNNQWQVTFTATDVTCGCEYFQRFSCQQTSSAVMWCNCILFMFKKMGKLPGDFAFLQQGFTPRECEQFLEQLADVQADVASDQEGVWRIMPPTSRAAKCQGKYGIGGRKCTRNDIGARENRVVVWGKLNITDPKDNEKKKWVKHKFSFHVCFRCINCNQLCAP